MFSNDEIAHIKRAVEEGQLTSYGYKVQPLPILKSSVHKSIYNVFIQGL